MLATSQQVQQSEASPRPRQPHAGRRIPTLDGMRAVSIALVLLGHLAGTKNFPWLLGPLGEFASFGVRIFFVISGFLITDLLLRERAERGEISLPRFYLRRVFRIFPAAYVFIGGLALCGGLLSQIKLNPHDLLFAATYTANFSLHRSWYVGHLWSLSVEEQFYLLWPAALALLGVTRSLKVATVVIAVSPVVRILTWYLAPDWRDRIDQVFPTIADPLAVGCCLAIQRNWLWERVWYRRLLESPWMLAIPLVALAANLTGVYPLFSFVVAEPIMNFGIAMTLDYCMRHATSPVGRLLDLRPIVFVGVLSYSLYLWQQPFLNRDGSAFWNTFPVNLLLACSFALASYTLVERPFLRLKDRFAAGARRTAK
jgi:peptidoglycan/LPS O-acetylase OafA/YrhL